MREGKGILFFFLVFNAASGSSQVLSGHCDCLSQGSVAENKTRLKGMLLVSANFTGPQ